MTFQETTTFQRTTISTVRLLPVLLVWGCVAASHQSPMFDWSAAPLNGSLEVIKNEQRTRLYNRCMIAYQDLLFHFPHVAMDVTGDCREWGYRKVW